MRMRPREMSRSSHTWESRWEISFVRDSCRGILDHRVGGLGRRSIGHHTTIPEDYLPKDHNVPALRLSSLGQLLGRPGADKNHPATQ